MAHIKRISERQIKVINSSWWWTFAVFAFVIILLVPGIYCLIAASGGASPTGESTVSPWVGAVLVLLSALGALMLLPFTVTTTTTMDKSSDVFSQEHNLLHCVPCTSCLPTSTFALSIIESVEVDGPLGMEDESDDTEPDSEDEGEDLKEFVWRYGKPRQQVVVHTKFDTIPITSLTTAGNPLLPASCRDGRMSPTEVKKEIEEFLGIENAMFQPRGDGQASEEGGMRGDGVGLEFVVSESVRPGKRRGRRREEEEEHVVTNPLGRPITKQSQERALPFNPSAPHTHAPLSLAPLPSRPSGRRLAALPPPVSANKMEVSATMSPPPWPLVARPLGSIASPEEASLRADIHPSVRAADMGWSRESSNTARTHDPEIDHNLSSMSLGPREPIRFQMGQATPRKSKERKHKKDMTPEEKEQYKADKRAARAHETPEEKSERKAKKAEKKARKAAKHAAAAGVPSELADSDGNV